MYEYMFFDEELRQRFISFARGQGVACEQSDDNMGLLAVVPEDVPESAADALDEYYDELLEQQAERVDQAEGEAAYQAAGIRVVLEDGSPCMIKLDPSLANQLLAAFSLEEVQTLVQAIASSVEQRSNGPICKR